MLKDARTYEIMRPGDVGQDSNQLVLGRHSGRHAVGKRAEQIGLTLTSDELAQVYHAVVTMGEHRRSIGDNDIRRIVERVRTGQTVDIAG
jgi:2-isopropylmalate synthase